MKHSFIYGAILLSASATAQAQQAFTPEKAPPLLVPMAPVQTPALNAFAGVGRPLQLQTRWVQIDADILPTALPAWNNLGAGTSSHVAAPDELRALEILVASGTVTVSSQQLNVVNNQTANLSFSPFTIVESLPLLPQGPIDDMIIPRADSRFDVPPPYIPNLASPESKLPEMAPMPMPGGKNDPPFIAPIPAPNPYSRPQMSRELAELMAYRFQIRPTLIGDQIALALRSLNSADNIAATATVNPGETVVYSLPNILELQGPDKVRRTFLLVTPRLAMPRSPLEIPALPTP